jgi:hypothetical protein
MSLQKLVSRYISSAEHAFDQIKVAERTILLDASNVKNVADHAKAYLEDAKYYREKQKLEVSLTSVAYCEGLLDALRLLGAVRFEWYIRPKTKRNEE